MGRSLAHKSRRTLKSIRAKLNYANKRSKLRESGVNCDVLLSSSSGHQGPEDAAPSVQESEDDRNCSLSDSISFLDMTDDGKNSDFEYPPLTVEKVAIDDNLGVCGNRIVNISHLAGQFRQMANHEQICTGGRFSLIGENRNGFHTTFEFQCVCGATKTVTSDKNETTLNDAAVWGSMSIGIGRTQMEELFSVMNIPVMAAKTFRKHEIKIGKLWRDHLDYKMKLNGAEELRLAKENNQYVNGKPYIIVVVDGGWSKRSYGHGYNASSGIACIIGARTKKLLYLGVKNKYCVVCARATAANLAPKEHACFRNYSGTSTGMEQEVIVEGFNASIADHGLIYKYMVGDGDSSVFARVREKVAYGRYVEKIECANHVIRCFKDNLHKLCANKMYNLGSRKLIKGRIDRLCKGARAAIRNCDGDAQKLKAALINGPYHVLGKHNMCGEFCNRKDIKELDLVPQVEKSNAWPEMKRLVTNLAWKAEQLKHNVTTNQAERLMGCVVKFSGGKRVNFSTGGSYERRGIGAGLAHTSGPAWHASPWKRLTKKSPGAVFKKYLDGATSRNSKRRLAFENDGPRPRRRKLAGSAGPDLDYGPKAAAVDISPEKMEYLQGKLLEELQEKVSSQDKINELERATVGQRTNPLWFKARQDILTASNFGRVMSRKSITPCHNKVKYILYGKPIHSKAVQYGIDNEPTAIKAYEEERSVEVRECGIFIHPEFPYLGASPDGLIGEDGLIEVKCLFAIGKQRPRDAARDPKNDICVQFVNGRLCMKPLHAFRYQIQGQLNIANRKYCDLLLYSEGGLDILRIERDANLWENTVLPKLKQFYLECLLPEIVDGRIPRGMPVREPQFILDAIEEHAKSKKTPRN